MIAAALATLIAGPLTRAQALAGSSMGVWTAGPLMLAPLDRPSATLLQNGMVLVVEGDSPELYDPASNTWTAAGHLETPRAQHTATLLKDGRVLVVGGIDPTEHAIGNADLYDPVTNSWSAAASLPGRRWGHTATLLPSGAVLVIGGVRAGVELDDVEVYDPAQNSWSPAASMPVPRGQHTATLLTDGTVLIASGGTHADSVRYDPVRNAWLAGSPMLVARSEHTATLLRDGRVLVVGGIGPSGPLSSAELYDPASGTWSSAGSLVDLGLGHAATLLGDGRVLVTGGAGVGYLPAALREATEFDPGTGQWTTIGSMTVGRIYHLAVLLPRGNVLVAGGRDRWLNGEPLESTELFNPVAEASQAATPGSAGALAPSAVATGHALVPLTDVFRTVPFTTTLLVLGVFILVAIAAAILVGLRRRRGGI